VKRPRRGPALRPAASNPGAHALIVVLDDTRVSATPRPVALHGAVAGLPKSPITIRSLFDEDLVREAAKRQLALPGGLRLSQLFVLEGAPVQELLAHSGRLIRRRLLHATWIRPLPSPTLPGGGNPAVQDADTDHQGYLWGPDEGVAAVVLGKEEMHHWGIGVMDISGVPGSSGAGARIHIVERGWHLCGLDATPAGHADVPGMDTDIVWGEACGGHAATWSDLRSSTSPSYASAGYLLSWRDHGLADLGTIKARPGNARYGRGIAPSATVLLYSTWSPTAPREVDLYNTLLRVLLSVQPGDIVLIEEQLRDVTNTLDCPIECDPLLAYFLDAIQADALVVEAAGNSGVDVSTLRVPYCGSTTALSGSCQALMVAGANVASHTRDAGSNFGARVDAFAWGNCVYQTLIRWNTALGAIFDDADCTRGGTSPATAIIAGAAAALQGVYLAHHGAPANPAQLRSALLANATPPEATSEPIGHMPNLKEAVLSLGIPVP